MFRKDVTVSPYVQSARSHFTAMLFLPQHTGARPDSVFFRQTTKKKSLNLLFCRMAISTAVSGTEAALTRHG
ncbi:hypothetical protein KCP73_07040 [Salmonella enterica subsp. enterica]|nr:hypothetical protein KCP73_07040 [Salmonella enterica subsp. enterica]